MTYHLAYPGKGSCVTCHQWSAVVHAVGRRNHNRVRHDDTRTIPPRGHRATKRIEQILGFSCDALATARLALLNLRHSIGLPVFQSTGIQSMQWRDSIGEGGRFSGLRGWGERNELEGLYPGDGNNVIVPRLSLFTVGSVDSDKVGDWASCEKSALDRGRGRIGADANAIKDI